MLNINRTITGTPSLTLTEVKNFIRVDYNEDDTLLDNLILQSMDLIENYLDRSMVESDVILTASGRTELILPLAPIDTITSIKDADGNELDYTYDGLSVKLKSTGTFTVEYSTTANNEGGLTLGWMEVIAYMYENRGDDTPITSILYTNANLLPFRNKLWV